MIAVIMQAYSLFEIASEANGLPQDRIYDFYRCLNKDFS